MKGSLTFKRLHDVGCDVTSMDISSVDQVIKFSLHTHKRWCFALAQSL